MRGLRRPLRTATSIIAAEFGRYAASRGAPVVRDRRLNARYLVAIPSSALGRLRAAVGFTVNDRNRCAAEVVDAELTVRNGSTAAGQVPQSKVYVRLSEGSLASATVCMSWDGGPIYWLVVAAHPQA